MNFLRNASSPAEILSLLASPGFQRPEQWQGTRFRRSFSEMRTVLLYSSLSDGCGSQGAFSALPRHWRNGEWFGSTEWKWSADLPFLPQGPLTIPYLG